MINRLIKKAPRQYQRCFEQPKNLFIGKTYTVYFASSTYT